jgi:hypothetical protein
MGALTQAWRDAAADTRAQIADAVFVFAEVTGEAGPEAPKPVIFKCPSCALVAAGRTAKTQAPGPFSRGTARLRTATAVRAPMQAR